MAQQILKEYELYEDLVRLNHPDYFQATFDTPDTLAHFATVDTVGGGQHKTPEGNSVRFFLKNLQFSQEKDVFLMLKWLITTHKIVRNATRASLIGDIYDCLGRMCRPQIGSSIENYIYTHLVRPYTQYLRKFCLLVQPGAADKENQQHGEKWYLHCNLVRFATRELGVAFRQLLGFFGFAYPFLCTFAKLVHQDLTNFYGEMKREGKSKAIVGVSVRELEEMEREIGQLQACRVGGGGEEFLDEGMLSARFCEFLSSERKEVDRTASFEGII